MISADFTRALFYPGSFLNSMAFSVVIGILLGIWVIFTAIITILMIKGSSDVTCCFCFPLHQQYAIPMIKINNKNITSVEVKDIIITYGVLLDPII